MQNIKEYIKNNEYLKDLDFLTVYLTIIELARDNQIIIESSNVDV